VGGEQEVGFGSTANSKRRPTPTFGHKIERDKKQVPPNHKKCHGVAVMAKRREAKEAMMEAVAAAKQQQRIPQNEEEVNSSRRIVSVVLCVWNFGGGRGNYFGGIKLAYWENVFKKSGKRVKNWAHFCCYFEYNFVPTNFSTTNRRQGICAPGCIAPKECS
jgi:hypothetical protein